MEYLTISIRGDLTILTISIRGDGAYQDDDLRPMVFYHSIAIAGSVIILCKLFLSLSLFGINVNNESNDGEDDGNYGYYYTFL